MPSQKRIIELCNLALESIRGLITEEQHQAAYDDVNRHDEWALGIEFVIDWLNEEGISINRKQFDAIYAAMSAMGLGEDDRVRYLKTQNLRGSQSGGSPDG